jgi:signal peptidase I
MSASVSAGEDRASRRKPSAGALFSFLVPGLGQLYAGRIRRALIAALLSLAAELLAIPLVMMLHGGIQLLLFALIVIFLHIIIPWDAYRLAREATPQFVLRNYNRWYVYTSLLLISALIVRPAILRFTKAHVARAYHVPSTSMQPGLLAGDFVLSRIRRGPTHRGEIVVYMSADGTYLKRIVGIPGDTLSMNHGALSVNGRAIEEPYTIESDTSIAPAEDFSWQRKHLVSGIDSLSYHPTPNAWGPIVVPSSQYFVLGDHRSQSKDSRYDGFVDERAIIAEPTTVYFSRDPESKTIRWRRIGMAIP